MPTSIVIELHAEQHIFGEKVKFSSPMGKATTFEMPEGIWNELDKPDKLRVRIEDAWNDPDRRW